MCAWGVTTLWWKCFQKWRKINKVLKWTESNAFLYSCQLYEQSINILWAPFMAYIGLSNQQLEDESIVYVNERRNWIQETTTDWMVPKSNCTNQKWRGKFAASVDQSYHHIISYWIFISFPYFLFYFTTRRSRPQNKDHSYLLLKQYFLIRLLIINIILYICFGLRVCLFVCFQCLQPAAVGQDYVVLY